MCRFRGEWGGRRLRTFFCDFFVSFRELVVVLGLGGVMLCRCVRVGGYRRCESNLTDCRS